MSPLEHRRHETISLRAHLEFPGERVCSRESWACAMSDALLPKLMSGEIRVKDAAKQVEESSPVSP